MNDMVYSHRLSVSACERAVRLSVSACVRARADKIDGSVQG